MVQPVKAKENDVTAMVAEFDSGRVADAVETVTVIDRNGMLTGNTPVPTDLDRPALVRLHEALATTRILDREFVNLQRQGQLTTYAPCLGQEAAQVGSASALTPTDWMFPSYRDLGCAVVRDIPIAALAHLWQGSWFTDIDVRRHRFAPVSVPVGTNSLHAVGVALGAKLAAEPIVVAVYFGDGATSTGDVHEAMNFASVFHVPCIFVVQNNGWAISTPTARQSAAPTLAHRAAAYGMQGFRCDGNDVLATYAAMRKAVDHARNGGGPAVVEAITYRMGPHTMADDPTRYRSAAEEARWSECDPIERYERFLGELGVLGPDEIEHVRQQSARAVTALRDALVQNTPDPLELFEHVYLDPPNSYTRQRLQMAAELAAWANPGEADR
jgi:2-oxoisovalerate dehydrogenase E1 component alpha subunit